MLDFVVYLAPVYHLIETYRIYKPVDTVLQGRDDRRRFSRNQPQEGTVDGVIVKLAESEWELEGAIAVRMRVFVAEQSIPPEEELDEADATATHAVALCQGKVVGTGRLVYPGNATAQIGRMAVEPPFRRRGIGGQILECLEQEARARRISRCILHAQEYVKTFYAAHGYKEHGDVFLEVSIPHIEMRKEL